MHFRTQIIAWQPISDNQVAACVFQAYDFPYHPQSAPSSRTSNTPSVLQTLRSPLSRGTKHLARSFIFLSGVPPQHCTSLICTHIKYCIGILFFQQLLFYFQSRPPLKDRASFLHTNFIRWRMSGLRIPSGLNCLPVYASVNILKKKESLVCVRVYAINHAMLSLFLISSSTIQNRACSYPSSLSVLKQSPTWR